MTSTLLSFISLALALCTTSLAALPRSPLSKRDIRQFSNSVLFSRQGYEGFFLNIDVEGEAVPAQIDIRSSDLIVTGNLTTLAWTAGTSVRANISLPFLNPPISGSQEIIVGNVTIGGSPAGKKQLSELGLAFDSTDNQGLAHAIPQSAVHAVLGLGPTRQSAVAKAARDFSPLDNLCLNNAANPFVTLLYAGVDHTKPTDSPLVAGFFSVGGPIPTGSLFPNNPLAKKLPDLSKITQRSAVTLNGAGAFTVPNIFVNGVALPLSSHITGAEPDSAFAVLSTTSKYNFVPKDVAHGIYGKAPGVSFDVGTGLYHLPCNTEITVQVQIGSGSTTIPLDPQTVVIPDESNEGKCVGSFKVLPHEIPTWDHLYGLTFLKNAYLLLGYEGSNGQDLTTFIVKMLALTDAKEAHADFARVRGSPSGSTDTTASGNVELAGNISDDNNSTSSSGNTSNGPTGSVAEQLKHCLPAIIVLAIVVGLVLIGSVVFCVVSGRRRSGGKASAYRSLHDAETSAHSKGLYAHDEETKYTTPYTDGQ